MKLLTATQASKELGVALSTFYNWIQKGQAPRATIINGRKWYTKDSIEEWTKGKMEEQK